MGGPDVPGGIDGPSVLFPGFLILFLDILPDNTYHPFSHALTPKRTMSLEPAVEFIREISDVDGCHFDPLFDTISVTFLTTIV